MGTEGPDRKISSAHTKQADFFYIENINEYTEILSDYFQEHIHRDNKSKQLGRRFCFYVLLSVKA